MKSALALLTAAVALLAVASTAPAAQSATWKGVVVAKDVRASTVAFANANGTVHTARAATTRSLRIGDRLRIRGVARRDGTIEAARLVIAGRATTVRIKGILTKVATNSIELVVAKSGFVTLALPAGFTLPAGIRVFDEVRLLAVVATDGRLTVLAIRDDDDRRRDDDDNDRDEDDEVEVRGTISALSTTSITVTGRRGPVTCALTRPLSGFAVGNVVELKCVTSGAARTLVLQRIEHEDDEDDDDHSGPGRGDDDDDDDNSGPGGGGHGG